MTAVFEEALLAQRINADGLALIREFEGLHLTPYLCPGRIWTIGYGHTRTVREGMRLTPEQAELLLDEDVRLFERAVARMVRVRNNRLIQGSFNPYFDSSGLDWYALAAANTDLAMFKQIGSATTEGGILLAAPTVQIQTPQRAQNGNLDALSLTWKGRHDVAGAAPTTDLERSAFRIHLF